MQYDSPDKRYERSLEQLKITGSGYLLHLESILEQLMAMSVDTTPSELLQIRDHHVRPLVRRLETMIRDALPESDPTP